MLLKQPPLSDEQMQAAIAQRASNQSTTQEDFNASLPVLQDALAQKEAAQQAALAPKVEDKFSTVLRAARDESITHYITAPLVNAMFHDDSEFKDYDPNYDPVKDAETALLMQGLPVDSENLNAIANAGTFQDAVELAKERAKHYQRLEVLSRHPVAAITAGVLDPATLATTIATMGGGTVLQLGKASMAAGTAIMDTSLVAAADVAGRDTTAFDYVLTAGLGAGFGALSGVAKVKSIKEIDPSIPPVPTKDTFLNRTKAAFNRFASEADIVGPHAESQAVARDVVDDPVRREGYSRNDNAPAYKRLLDNQSQPLHQAYVDSLEETVRKNYGFNNVLSRVFDLGSKYSYTKGAVEREVYDILQVRNAEFQLFGEVRTPTPKHLEKAVTDLENLHNHMGMQAKGHIAGFEDFVPQPGYIHRIWEGDKIRAAEVAFKPKHVKGMLTRALKSGLPNLDHESAKTIATAILDRAKSKEVGQTVDFMGILGKDTSAFVKLLQESGMQGAALDSAVKRLESTLGEKGLPKYARNRLPIDTRTTYTAPDGRVLKMSDLLNTDVGMLSRNYMTSMNGRIALSKAGVGGDDAAIAAWKTKYYSSIKDLPKDQHDAAVQAMDGILADYLGNVPKENILGKWAQRGTSLAGSTMLGAMGVWQSAEFASIFQTFGVLNTAKAMIAQVPGIKQSLRQITKDPDLAEELLHIESVDLARDVRWEPWMKSHVEFHATTDKAIDRFLHWGKQAMPFITAQKYIHSMQVKMSTNLALNRFVRAMDGDAHALKELQSYSHGFDWQPLFARNSGIVTRSGKNAKAMNWHLWDKADKDQVLNAVIRYVDDTVLYQRVGQSSGFGRSAVGQVLGQFRSFVTLAHNKQLRGRIENQGALAYAQLLAYQFPLTVLMVTANEARKGNVGEAELDAMEKGANLHDLMDMDKKNPARDLLRKSLGYTGGLGFFADAAGTVGLTGSRGGLSVPMLSAASAPVKLKDAVYKQFDNDPNNDSETAQDSLKAVQLMIPTLKAIPGVEYYTNTMNSDEK